MSRNTVQRPIASLLAHSENANELLPHLHQHALDVTGGICSLLFRHNPRTGDLQATSGFALDSLRTDPWRPGPEEAALVAEDTRSNEDRSLEFRLEALHLPA